VLQEHEEQGLRSVLVNVLERTPERTIAADALAPCVERLRGLSEVPPLVSPQDRRSTAARSSAAA
jgi:hypothetical protein